jgi:sugar lactone lactonase YvrE
MKKIYLLTTLFLAFLSQAQTVSTFAGSGTAGSTDATGTAASFSNPRAVAVDASGNVYVADFINHKIRKITPAGVVSTFAGSGFTGSTDGTGTAASFRNPSGVAVDASGNVYVADYGNHKIRKITPSGVVSTFAGSGTQGSADATGTAASFNAPFGLAVDASGNIYVADTGNHKIRKITPAGVVSTLAGSGSYGSTDGTGTAAIFAFPNGVALDASGNVYVADTNNNKIRKITSAGVVSTFAGSGTQGSIDGTGTAASFDYPTGVAVDASGNVYVADTFNNKIRKITPAGVVSTLAGSGAQGSTDATGTAASFHYPAGVAVDAAGNVYVADYNNHKIRKITSVLSTASHTFTNLVGYPNPAKNTFTISIQENATATVYNLLGKAVASKTLISGENTIDISKLTNGVYMVTIQNEKGAQSIKLVKE